MDNSPEWMAAPIGSEVWLYGNPQTAGTMYIIEQLLSRNPALDINQYPADTVPLFLDCISFFVEIAKYRIYCKNVNQ